MAKGWRREPARHSLAARGHRSNPRKHQHWKVMGLSGNVHPSEWWFKFWKEGPYPEDWGYREVMDFRHAYKEIGKLQHYGTRSEELKVDHATVVVWYNGGAHWDAVDYQTRKLKKGDTVILDANEFMMPFPLEGERGQSFKEKVVKTRNLPKHPLYILSTEAREAGLVDPDLQRLAWLGKQMDRAELDEERGKRL